MIITVSKLMEVTLQHDGQLLNINIWHFITTLGRIQLLVG